MLFYLDFLSHLDFLQVLAFLLAFILAIAIAMSFHEYAHARTAYAFGDDTARLSGRMTLNPLAHITPMGLVSFMLIGFGWAKPVPINPAKFRSYKKHSSIVLLSGVLTNLLLAFVFSGLFYFLGSLLASNAESNICFFLYYFFSLSIHLNLVLFLFNLIPLPPLDGFNLISLWTKYNNKFVDFLTNYSFLILLFLVLPFFNGGSLLSLIYDHVIPAIASVFGFFWGLFV